VGLWGELFSSWAGFLSLLIILFMLGMGGFIAWFMKNSDQHQTPTASENIKKANQP